MRILVAVTTIAALLACTGAPQTSEGPSAQPAPNTAAPAPEPAKAPAAASDIPLYSPTPLQRDALESKTLRELSLMRNTIFARVGNPFNKPWLREYFAGQPWYTPKPRAELERLSEVDRQNAALIAEVESSISADELNRRKNDLISKEGELTAEEIIELELLSVAFGQYIAKSERDAALRNPLEDPSVLDRKLKPAQIADLSRRDLRIARNTIFARHGRQFQSPVLAAWFAQKGWYDIDPNYSDAMLTEIDKANINLLKAREEELGGAMTDADHAIEDSMGGGMFAA